MSVDFKIEGGEAMQKRLLKLSVDVETKIGKKAVRAAATEYARRVRKQIPLDNKDDIHLKKSIGVQSGRKKTPGFVYAVAGVKGSPTKDARRYAHIFEFGSIHYVGRRVFSKTLRSDANQILERMTRKIKLELDKLNA